MTGIVNSVERSIISALEEKEKEVERIINCYEHIQSKHNDDDSLEKIRERRLRELENYHRERHQYLAKGHGVLNEVYNDKDFFDICKRSNLLVIHFYRPSTVRCQKVDGYLSKLSEIHFKILFVKLNVERAPFVSERLKIWCIPTIAMVKDSKVIHSIIGLDELGGDEFSQEDFEAVIDRYLK